VAAMSQVPSIFFKDDFSLESPDLWSTELSTARVGCTADDVEAPVDNLTSYLDIIESHLLKEIEARHEAFFEASVEVQHLRDLVFDLHRSISSIKATTHGLRKETEQGMVVSEKLQRERGNLRETLGMLSIMGGVAAAQSALSAVLPMDDLSSSSAVSIDYAGAINILYMIHGILGTTTNGPAGITNKNNKEVLKLKCFADLSTKLSSAESYIEQAASMELLDRFRFTGAQAAAASALFRFRTHVDKGRESGDRIVDTVSLHLAIEQWGLMMTHYNGCGKKKNGGGGGAIMGVKEENSNNKEEEGEEEEERMLKWQQESLLPPIAALLRLGRLPAAIDSVRETSKAALHVAIDDIIEACLDKLTSTHMVPSSASCTTSRNESTTMGGGGKRGGHVVASSLSSNTSSPIKQQTGGMTDGLQRITGEQFQMTMETVLLVVVAHMDHIKSLVTAIQSAVHSLQSTGTDIGDNNENVSSVYAAIDTHLGECTKFLALASASRWSKLLSTRSTSSKSTPPASLAILKDILATTDVMAGMLESHHVGARISVAGLKQAIQQLCKSAMDHMHGQAMGRMSAMLDQEIWVAAPVSGHIQQFVDSLLLAGNDCDTDGTNNGGGEPELKLRIGGHNNNASCYQVVQSMLLLLNILNDYLAFRKAVPSFNAEVTQRAVHLLKAFNLRSCQLVLGAGAMQTAAGLRSITAKHLALCCSSIDALSALVDPYLQQAFTGSMPSSPRQNMLVRDFSTISQDLGTHSGEIVAKLQSIMADRAQAGARQLPSLVIQWSNRNNTDDDDDDDTNTLPKTSEFASSIAKQVTILVNVVTPILQEERCRKLLGNVVTFSATTAIDAFTSLEQQLLDQQQQLASGAVAVAVTRGGDDTATTTGSNTIQPAQQQQQQQQQPIARLENRGFVNWRKQVEADAAELLKCFQSLPLHDEEKGRVVTLLGNFIAEWQQKTAVLQVVLQNEQVNNTKEVVEDDVLVSRKEEEEEKEVNEDAQEEGPERIFVDIFYAENGDGISQQKEEEEEVVVVVEKKAEEPPSPPSVAVEQQQDNDLSNVDLGTAVVSSFDHPLALPSPSTTTTINNNNDNGTCTFTATRFEDDGNNDTGTS